MESSSVIAWDLDRDPPPKLYGGRRRTSVSGHSQLYSSTFKDHVASHLDIDDLFMRLSYDSAVQVPTAALIDSESIQIAERAATLSPNYGFPKSRRYLQAARILLTILSARFDQTRSIKDLEKAISVAENACCTSSFTKSAFSISLRGNDNVEVMPSFEELTADLYVRRFYLIGNAEDIDRALSYLLAAECMMRARGAATSHDAYALLLYNLGILYYEKYRLTKDAVDLDHAVARIAHAINRASPVNPDRPSFLGTLGRMLHERFDEDEDWADLESAIEHTQQAIDLLARMETIHDTDELASYIEEVDIMLSKREAIISMVAEVEQEEQSEITLMIAEATPEVPEDPSSTSDHTNPAVGTSIVPSQSLNDPRLALSVDSPLFRTHPQVPNAVLAIQPRILGDEVPQLLYTSPTVVKHNGFGQSYSLIVSPTADKILFDLVRKRHLTELHGTSIKIPALPASQWYEEELRHTATVHCAEDDGDPELPSQLNTVDSDTDSTDIDSYGNVRFQSLTYIIQTIVQQAVGRKVQDAVRAGQIWFNQPPSDQNTPTSESTRGKSGSGCAEASSSSLKTTPHGGKRRSHLPGQRSQGGQGSDAEDEDDIPRKRPRKVNSQSCNAIPRRLKCPYYQRHPERHPDASCRGAGFQGMAKLKDHLKRKHLRPIKCVCCWVEMPSLEARDEHLRMRPPCETRDEPPDDRVCRFRLDEWSFKAGDFLRAESEEKKWEILYRRLFPDDATVPSPYEFSGMSSQTERRFVDILKEEVLKELDPAIQEIHAKLNEIIHRTRNRLYEETESASSQSASNSPPTPAAADEASDVRDPWPGPSDPVVWSLASNAHEVPRGHALDDDRDWLDFITASQSNYSSHGVSQLPPIDQDPWHYVPVPLKPMDSPAILATNMSEIFQWDVNGRTQGSTVMARWGDPGPLIGFEPGPMILEGDHNDLTPEPFGLPSS